MNSLQRPDKPSNSKTSEASPQLPRIERDLGIYGPASARDEGGLAHYLIGNHVDDGIKPGFKYKIFRGAAPNEPGKLHSLLPEKPGGPVVLLSSIRPCRAQGPNLAFTLKGEETIYSDLGTYPNGFVFFPHALSLGDTFTLFHKGVPCGEISCLHSPLHQRVIWGVDSGEKLRIPGVEISFGHTPKFNGTGVQYEPASYSLQNYSMVAPFGLRLFQGVEGSDSEVSRVFVECQVVASDRDALPLTVSITEVRGVLPSRKTAQMLLECAGVIKVRGLVHLKARQHGAASFTFNPT